MADEVFTTGNANVQAFSGAVAHARSRGDAAEAARVAVENARLALPAQITALTAPAIQAAQDAANLATQRAGILGSVTNDAALTGKPAGDYRQGREIVTWNGSAITGRTVELASAAEAAASRNAIGNTVLATLGARTQSDGPQFVDGSRWLWLASGTANGGTIVAASGAGFWHREHQGEYQVPWFRGRTGGALTNMTLQYATDAAAANGIGKVVLGPYTYDLTTIQPGQTNYQTQTFFVPRNDMIYEGGILRVPNGFLSGTNDLASNAHFMQCVNPRNQTFRDMVFDGNGANNINPPHDNATQVGIRNQIGYRSTLGGENVTFENVKFRNIAGANCINMTGAPQNVRIDAIVENGGPYVEDDQGNAKANPNNHDFSAFYVDGPVVMSGSWRTNPNYITRYCGGAELHGSDSTILPGTVIEGFYPAVYLSDTPGLPPVKNQQVSGVIMKDCFKGVVYAYFVAGAERPTIRDNIITLFKPPGITDPKEGDPVGIEHTGPGRSAGGYFGTAADGSILGNASTLKGGKLIGNDISAHPSQRTLFQSVGANLHSLHDYEILGNVFHDLGSYGVGLLGSAWGDNNVLIDDNEFRDVAQVPTIAAQAYRAGVFVAYLIDAQPKAISPDRAFTARNVRIGKNNRYINSVSQTVNGAGATTALSSAGRMLSAVSLINLSYYAPLTDVVIEAGECVNVAHRIYYSNNPALSYNIEAVALGVSYRPKLHTSSVRPVQAVTLYPGDTIHYPDGARGIYTSGQPTYQAAPLNSVVGSTQAGSRTVPLSGPDAHLLRPGMFIQVGTHYSTVRTVDSLTQITLEDPAPTAQGGVTVQVVSVPPIVMAKQPAPADLPTTANSGEIAAYVNNLVDRLTDAGVLG